MKNKVFVAVTFSTALLAGVGVASADEQKTVITQENKTQEEEQQQKIAQEQAHIQKDRAQLANLTKEKTTLKEQVG